MTTANIAEVLKLAAKPVQHDNDEKIWAQVPFQARELLHLGDDDVKISVVLRECRPFAGELSTV